MKKILYLILGLIGVLSVKAQPDCFFTHYSSEDGLSQNTVMSILQDRKGNIWLATWDGINKFNGYSFKTYKARLDNRIVLSHNRIDHMLEDKYGFLWLQTYDNHAYRFDPRTETFERAPGDDEEGGTANITNIKVLPGGSVWLLTETEGVIRVATDPQDYSLTSQYYSTQSGQFSASRVFLQRTLTGMTILGRRQDIARPARIFITSGKPNPFLLNRIHVVKHLP